MSPRTIAAALAVACGLTGAPARAQSLADAAKRAEEQHVLGPATKEYTNASLGSASGYEVLLGDHYLLSDHFDAYASARDSVAGMRMQSLELDRWLFERLRLAKDRFDREQIYGQDSTVMFALKQITPREYFKTDLAFAHALDDARLSAIDREHLPPARRANAQYVLDHNLAGWAKGSWSERELESRRASRGGFK